MKRGGGERTWKERGREREREREKERRDKGEGREGERRGILSEIYNTCIHFISTLTINICAMFANNLFSYTVLILNQRQKYT